MADDHQQSTGYESPLGTAKPFRLLAYSHDSVGLGHLRRSISIATALVRRGPRISVLCVTGSPTPDLFVLPERCDVVKIPSIGKDAEGRYVARRIPASTGEIASVRSDVITAAVRSFRPHVLLVDHTPKGPGDELLPVLERVRGEGMRTRTVLGLRDVIDQPDRVRHDFAANGTLDVIRRYYDDVMVYGDPSILNVAEYGFDRALVDRVRYVGVVAVPPGAKLRGADRSRPHLVATAGGGEDGYPTLRGVIAALRGPLRNRAIRSTVVAGPMMSEGDFEALALARQGDERIEILRSTRTMGRLLDSADAVVSMGGYNAIYESVSRRLPLTVLPRIFPRREQIERCTRLAKRGVLTTLEPGAAARPNEMAAAIDSMLSTPQMSAAPWQFNGAEIAADHLLADGERSSSFRLA